MTRLEVIISGAFLALTVLAGAGLEREALLRQESAALSEKIQALEAAEAKRKAICEGFLKQRYRRKK